jgi:hypothetical protein
MLGVEAEQLRGGACLDLPPQVVDKYFHADRRTEPFQHKTAIQMCGQCAVRLSCLIDAIENPTTTGVRGGEPAESIRALNHEHRRERTPTAELARRAIGWQLPPLRGAYGQAGLRAGRMPDMPLLHPELGEEA